MGPIWLFRLQIISGTISPILWYIILFSILGGVVSLAEDLAIELAPKGININAIGPGIIESDMTASMLADEKTKAGFLARIPKGRIGKPEDIGAAAVFLASDEADYVTGVTLYVDGGWLTQ